MAARTDLERTLETMIRDIVKSGEVVDVLFERGEEIPYENMLKIKVIYQSPNQLINSSETMKVMGDLWKTMIELKDPDFPHVRFVSLEDVEASAAAE